MVCNDHNMQTAPLSEDDEFVNEFATETPTKNDKAPDLSVLDRRAQLRKLQEQILLEKAAMSVIFYQSSIESRPLNQATFRRFQRLLSIETRLKRRLGD